MGKLFGTDGIREVAGQGALAAPFVLRIGQALGAVLRERPEGFGPAPAPEARARLKALAGGRDPGPAVLIGRDTRASGPAIEGALAAGLAAAGVSAVRGGVLPTPAVAWLTARLGCDAGVVVSASHNPREFNGIKVFARNGLKADDAAEERIEALVEQAAPPPASVPGTAIDAPAIVEEYRAASEALAPPRDFTGKLRLALDCSNGAASATAPEVFRRLGARVRVFAAAPDGRNINEGCGALHPEVLQKRIEPGEIGLVFDGDADRLILLDEKGEIRDGDHLLGFAGAHLAREGRLPKKTIVATVMSNLGLEVFLRGKGIALTRTPVGDRHVVEAMVRDGHPLGGEQAGHIIYAPYARTGDGLWTALLVLNILRETGRPLHDLAAEVPRFPQVIVNVQVREKPPLDGLPAVAAAKRRIEERLGRDGRLVLRYSGTEPIARVMIEGPEKGEIEAMAADLAAEIRRAVGGPGGG